MRTKTHLSRFQRDQLGLIKPDLQKINATAVLHLLRLDRFLCDANVVGHVCGDLVELVERGKFLMELCDSIAQTDLSSASQGPITVRVGVQCDACTNRQYERRREQDSNPKPRKNNDASWQEQINLCLWAITGVSASVVASAALVNRSPQLLDRLNTLRKLFVRQYLFLRKITPDYAAKVKVVVSPETHCQDCGAPVPKMASGG